MKNNEYGILKLKALVIATIIIALGVGASFYIAKSNPPYRKVGQQFTADLAANNADAAFNLLSSNLQGQVGGQKQWTERVGKLFADQSSKVKYSGEVPIQNQQAAYGKDANPHRLSYSFTFNNGRTYTFYVVVATQNNEWKISEFNSTLQ